MLKMIHICYAFNDKNDNYSKFPGTSLYSLLKNSAIPDNITCHILHDNTFKIQNKDKFNRISNQFNSNIIFYNVETLLKQKIKEIFYTTDISLTIGTMYRLLIADALSINIDKVIYLDGDTIINLDIKELYFKNLENYPLAATPEFMQGQNQSNKLIVRQGFTDYEDYFNAGVLLLNLKFLRENENIIKNGLIYLYKNPRNGLADQTVLNYCFSKNYLKLPIRFNRMLHCYKNRETKIKKYIYHYSGNSLKITNNILDELWLTYFKESPWYYGDISIRELSNIYNRYGTLKMQQKKNPRFL